MVFNCYCAIQTVISWKTFEFRWKFNIELWISNKHRITLVLISLAKLWPVLLKWSFGQRQKSLPSHICLVENLILLPVIFMLVDGTISDFPFQGFGISMKNQDLYKIYQDPQNLMNLRHWGYTIHIYNIKFNYTNILPISYWIQPHQLPSIQSSITLISVTAPGSAIVIVSDQIKAIVDRIMVDIWAFLHARPRIPGGEKSIFTVVIH